MMLCKYLIIFIYIATILYKYILKHKWTNNQNLSYFAAWLSLSIWLCLENYLNSWISFLSLFLYSSHLHYIQITSSNPIYDRCSHTEPSTSKQIWRHIWQQIWTKQMRKPCDYELQYKVSQNWQPPRRTNTATLPYIYQEENREQGLYHTKKPTWIVTQLQSIGWSGFINVKIIKNQHLYYNVFIYVMLLNEFMKYDK